MRHRVFGRKLGRTKDERKRLFRNLATELILHGRLKTTVAKAKAVKPLIDKLVTKARKATLSAQRELAADLPKEAALILANTITPRFQNRTSGFSRIIYIGERSGDHAQMVVLEWTEQGEVRSDPSASLRAGKLEVRKEEKKMEKIEDKKTSTAEAPIRPIRQAQGKQKKVEAQKKPRRKRSVSKKRS